MIKVVSSLAGAVGKHTGGAPPSLVGASQGKLHPAETGRPRKGTPGQRGAESFPDRRDTMSNYVEARNSKEGWDGEKNKTRRQREHQVPCKYPCVEQRTPVNTVRPHGRFPWLCSGPQSFPW